ncbi:spore-associated protein A [Streptomyces qaidamensis]|uniref:spore-associated protein A n=1 Tax=Streptomyces qaidamensis TaxID=1783515 RepID=UPI0036E75695
MRKHRRITTIVASAATMLGLGVIAAPSASAAASYNGACGSGYSVTNSARIGNGGTIFLTYNSSNGYNCVVTIRDTPDSTPGIVSAGLGRNGDIYSWKSDLGKYQSYAGPVYVYGKGACMDWTGAIEGYGVAERKATNCG